MSKKKDEALKLALEALEVCQQSNYGRDWVWPDTAHPTAMANVKEAITAIREALAEWPAHESAYQRGYMDGIAKGLRMEQPAQQDMPKIGCVNHDCEQCKAQQEPVRVHVTDNTYNYAKSLAEAIFKQHFASDEHYSSGRIVWGVNDTVIGILTQIDNMVADMVRRPAQRKPLTDEQIKEIYEDCDAPTGGQFTLAFARAIEAAHGIKGDA